MATPKTTRQFLDLFSDATPCLKVKFTYDDGETPTTVFIENIIREQHNDRGIKYLESICTDPSLREFLGFYKLFDGFELGLPFKPDNCIKKPLIRLLPAGEIAAVTKKYMPGGEQDATINYNKSKTLFREGDPWIVIAEVDGGPACLTTFLEGENCGSIYYLTTQPHFNNLKPIAKTYQALLDRIAKDPAAFFRLVRAYVILQHADGYTYGYRTLEYHDN